MANPAEDWLDAFARRELALRGEDEAAHFLADFVSLVTMAEEPLPDGGRRWIVDRLQNHGECSVRQNAVTGEAISWYIEGLAEDGDESHPAGDMLALATATLQPPEDAVPAGAGYETQGDRTLFRARWRHEIGGIPVEGDYMEALVNGRHGKVFAVSRRWRQPRPGTPGTER